MRVIAEVLTNCEDDVYRRVSLKCEGIWDESDLAPSLNGIYLEKGDTVLVEYEDPENPIILGRLRTAKQKDNDPQTENEGVIIYQAKNGEDWSVLKVSKDSVYWENSKGVHLYVNGDSVDINVTKDLTLSVDGNITQTVKGDVEQTVDGGSTITVKSDATVKVEGNSTLEVGSNVNFKATKTTIDSILECTRMGIPDGQGPFCGIPNCLFSGAPHSASKTK